MKKMRKTIVLSLALALHCLVLPAQTQADSSSDYESKAVGFDGWRTIGIEYLPSRCYYPRDSKRSSESFEGFAINYTSATNITRKVPLFFEWGIGAQLSVMNSGCDVNGNKYKKYASLKATVSLVYDINLSNSVHLDPFAGVHFRVNGEDDRFQFGLQAGVKVRTNGFFVGVGYGKDLDVFDNFRTIKEWKLMAGFVI